MKKRPKQTRKTLLIVGLFVFSCQVFKWEELEISPQISSSAYIYEETWQAPLWQLSSSQIPLAFKVLNSSESPLRYHASLDGKKVLLRFDESPHGAQLDVSLILYYPSAQRLHYSRTLYIPNQEAAKVLISAFKLGKEGFIELNVQRSGSHHTFRLYAGIPENFLSSYSFPDGRWSAGQKIRVLLQKKCPDNQACLSSWNNSNGLFSLVHSENHISDAVLYSQRKSTRAKGFGTKNLYEQALWLTKQEEWKTHSGNPKDLSSFDAINLIPEGRKSPHTGPIQRKNEQDNHHAQDWILYNPQ